MNQNANIRCQLRAFCAFVLFVVLHASVQAQPTVILYVIDGLQPDAAMTAMRNGAVHLRFLHDSGVVAQEAYCTSPEARIELPDGSRPWGSAAPPNVAMHTGTHIFESKEIDDVFLAARRHGIRSVFAGSAENYRVINTADHNLAVNLNDSLVIAFVREKMRSQEVRLISIHVQQLRGSWSGPEEKSDQASPYIRAIVRADSLLGSVLETARATARWDSLYVIVTSDHGMGKTKKSDHPSSVRSSWETYLNFYGPGVRKGGLIPYAETPDIALFVAHVLRISPLLGHRKPDSETTRETATGTLLMNVFTGGPSTIDHPKFIKRFLESYDWSAPDSYAAYRTAMIEYLNTSRR